jgi:nucleoside-diphosphate-sugar epimerase
MRMLVIGGSGFVGTHVVSALVAEGHQVAVYHRGSGRVPLPAGVTGFRGDRRNLAADAAALRSFEPDVVVDMILSSGAQAAAVMQTFRGLARRIVVASSIDVYRACGVLYGFEPGPLEPVPLTEDSPLRTTLHPYPPAQLQIVKHVFSWLDDEYDKIPVERIVMGDVDLPGTVLRLPMIYGSGDPLHRLFPLVKRMDDRRPAIVFDERVARWRSPRGSVENVAAAIALAATSSAAAGRTYNVAEPEQFSELEWARHVASAAGWTGRLVVLPSHCTPAHLKMPGNLEQHWAADSGRIRRELGYREPIGREESLTRAVAWERAHPPGAINPQQFDYPAEDAALGQAIPDE